MNSDTTQVSALVTIIVPVFNDEETIAAALDSAVDQTLTQIEIIVVDDASSDKTPEIVASYMKRDPRIRLIRHPENMSAFQARRAGIFAANAPYVLFLDGDDELDRNAAARSAATAEAHEADIVQFGIQIFYPNGKSGDAWEQRSQPKHTELLGDDILPALFPPNGRAAGQLWKYLFRTEVLRSAYDLTPRGARFYRANDLPIAFLAALVARRYRSIPDKLYRYFWRRGASTLEATAQEAIAFQVSAIDAFRATDDAVREAAYRHTNPEALLASHAAATLSIAGIAMRWALGTSDHHLFDLAVGEIRDRVGSIDMIRAAVRHQPAVLERLAEATEPPRLGEREVKSVLITTANLTTGGVSMVVLAQAAFLAQHGHKVSIAVRRSGNDSTLLPEDTPFYEVINGDLADRLDTWADICRREQVDVVIDHRILYSTDWHAYALMAAALGIPTIGWIHNFAGRPTYDLNDMHGYLKRSLPSLAHVVALSPLDVAFWKLRGISHVSYLPNPPSPMILNQGADVPRRHAPGDRLELVWIGRLEQHTKQVRELIAIASELRTLEVEFRLRVIGPDQPGYSAARLNAAAEKAGLASYLEAVGALRGSELVAALDGADAFVGTSVIEGYQLTIIEAQSRGLPVFMYEMPWLVPVQDNQGVVSVPQGDALGLARQMAAILRDPERYNQLSSASLAAARRLLDVDYAALYVKLVNGALDTAYSPEPSLQDASQLLDLTIFFAERHSGIREKLHKAERTGRAALERVEKMERKEAYLRRQLSRIEKLERKEAYLRQQLSIARRNADRGDTKGSATTLSAPDVTGLDVAGVRDTPAPARSELLKRGPIAKLLMRARRNLGAALRLRARRTRVVGGTIRDSRLILDIRAPHGHEVVGAELRRHLADGTIELPLEVSRKGPGLYSASHDVTEGGKRRWRVAARVRSKGREKTLELPIETRASSSGDAHMNIRFNDGETVQFFRSSGRASKSARV